MNGSSQSPDSIRCGDCKHWTPDSPSAIYRYGVCLLASGDWDAPMKAWDDGQPNNPHLLTLSDHGCLAGVKNDGL